MDVTNIEATADAGFRVLLSAPGTQVAVMDLGPGEASGPKRNEHAESEQVLFVVRGEVEAEIGDERRALRAGDVVIVPRGVAHRFTGSGSGARTLNVYAPPAY